jgi:D-tagatose-1,6-bisphosphate aldolase subunit GatZ/KbaZ
VVGTEVPVPGGGSAGSHGIHVSTTADVEETLELSQQAFKAVDVESAWQRVRTVVAQPGVEFSDEELYTYVSGQAKHLEPLIHGEVPFVFEAHSTDYQPRTSLRGLVDDHFAILKVGPGLTFAYREALLALSYIEDEVCHAKASGVWHVLEQAMLSNPTFWQPFYSDDSTRAALSRSYSRSDRSRYYWPVPEVQAAVELMCKNLDEFGIPDELVSQYLPWLTADEVPGAPQTTALGERLTAEAVLRAAVRRVLTIYNAECTPA